MLSQDALRRLRDYATQVDRSSPDLLTGLYAVGSVALGDFRPPLSNIDVLAVAEQPWDAEAVGVARSALGALRVNRQAGRVACLTWSDLAGDPSAVTPPCLHGRRRVDSGELVNPLTWQVLRTSGVCLRGPEYPDLGAGDLRTWAADRLSGWWGSWLRTNRSRPGTLSIRRSTTERVLEVARLVQVVSSGRVVSKAEAGEAALGSGGERFQRILKDAVGFRRGLRASMYWGPFERKRDALAWIESGVALRAD